MNTKKLKKLRKTLKAEFDKTNGSGAFTKLYMRFNEDDEVKNSDMNREAHTELGLYLLAYTLKKHQVLQGMLASKFLIKASETWDHKADKKIRHVDPYRILEIARRYANNYQKDDPNQGCIDYDIDTIPELITNEAA